MPTSPKTTSVLVAKTDRDILRNIKRLIPTASPRVVLRNLLELVDRDELKAALLKEQAALTREFTTTGKVSDSRGLSLSDWMRLANGEGLAKSWLP
ncbi:MAG: hypothetical protein K0U78_12005 [Actinomycetia bacterium]|nr:hypothetical protein [Actinomycetes bacterium]